MKDCNTINCFECPFNKYTTNKFFGKLRHKMTYKCVPKFIQLININVCNLCISKMTCSQRCEKIDLFLKHLNPDLYKIEDEED